MRWFCQYGKSGGVMSAARLAQLDKQTAGYWPAWVFSGLGGAVAGISRGGVGARDRRGWSILAGGSGPAWCRGAIQTALRHFKQNQLLSAVQIEAVAWLPSHGRARMADFRWFWGHRRQFASLQTGSAGIGLELGQRARLERSGRGGFPLRPAARPPYPGRAGQTGPWQNPGSSPACGLACDITRLAGARNIPATQMGSGVKAAQRGRSSARKPGRCGDDGSGLGGDGAGHVRVNHGRATTLGAGRR